MDILLDPNIAYLLLAGGLALAVIAILNPGTGLLEITALFALLLSGWVVYNLADQVNWWALVVIFAGALLFIVAVYRFGHLLLVAAAITAIVIGSAFLFRGLQWWSPAVNPVLAASVGILSGGFFWVAARKAIEANRTRPTHDLGALVGMIGEARSEIHQDGSVQVGGELWSATSDEPISEGKRVRVLERQGFVLHVEAIE